MKTSPEAYKMPAAIMVAFAKRWAALGSAVQEQAEDLLAGDADELNSNAVRLIQRTIGGWNEELDEVLSEYWEERKDVTP